MLGLFLPTQTGGFSQSTYPRGTDWTFDYNRALVLKAESHGLTSCSACSNGCPRAVSVAPHITGKTSLIFYVDRRVECDD
ncbi:luciferase-like monooxygenase [Caballeronia sordidicola]|uniref:Luciferase-like monooxygenase n=1 Tax=Caballeronia sordidicola TaxID=196367 RepID=A0A158GVY1_CABSO|nr:luciferase-like monooxygenase [Caballeronia sordidicola]